MAYKIPPPPALSCAFNAKPASTLSNVTGDGTEYAVIFGTENYDRGSDYNAGTGVFTAPVDGIYSLGYTLYLSGSDIEHYYGLAQLYVNGASTNGSYHPFNPGMFAIGSNFNLFHTTSHVEVSMSATQTAYVTILVSGSGKTVDVNTLGTKFYGHLIAET